VKDRKKRRGAKSDITEKWQAYETKSTGILAR